MTETDIRCIKCNEEVTLENSHASGRNALRRVCGECSATDRWLQRCRKTKDKKMETEKEKEARLSAEKVTLSLSKMSSEEKVAWYKKQKEERAESGGSRKRTFETAVGALTEAKKRLESQQDVDRWFRFKDWAAREVLLTGAKPEELPRLWKSETSKPGAITKVVRGELLLKEWTGCEDRLGSLHELSASVKQRMDLCWQARARREPPFGRPSCEQCKQHKAGKPTPQCRKRHGGGGTKPPGTGGTSL